MSRGSYAFAGATAIGTARQNQRVYPHAARPLTQLRQKLLQYFETAIFLLNDGVHNKMPTQSRRTDVVSTA
jgi:hypothetical protein